MRRDSHGALPELLNIPVRPCLRDLLRTGCTMTSNRFQRFSSNGSVRMTERRILSLDARPALVEIDPDRTAVIVVDMQNDFGSEGGMFHRAGIDICGIQAAVAPTTRVLDAARSAGMTIIYLKMEFESDLSNTGGPECAELDHASQAGRNWRAMRRSRWQLRPDPDSGHVEHCDRRGGARTGPGLSRRRSQCSTCPESGSGLSCHLARRIARQFRPA